MLAPASDARAAIYVDDASFGTADDTAAAATPSGRVSAALASSSTRPKAGGKRPAAALAAAPASDDARVVINEVLYDPDSDGPDAGRMGRAVQRRDRSGVSQAGRSPTTAPASRTPSAVPADAYAVLPPPKLLTRYPEYGGPLVVPGGRIGNSLGNDGDRSSSATNGAAVDAVSWGTDTSVLDPAVPDVPAGHSIERRTAGVDINDAADFTDNNRRRPAAHRTLAWQTDNRDPRDRARVQLPHRRTTRMPRGCRGSSRGSGFMLACRVLGGARSHRRRRASAHR